MGKMVVPTRVAFIIENFFDPIHFKAHGGLGFWLDRDDKVWVKYEHPPKIEQP